MTNNVFFTIIVILFIVADVANAAFFWNVRKLTATSPIEAPNTTVLPVSSPASNEKQSSTAAGEDKKQNKKPSPNSASEEDKAKDKQYEKSSPDSTSGQGKSKDKQVKDFKGFPPPADAKKGSKTPKEQVKDNNDRISSLPQETCDGIERRCQDSKLMTACIKSFDNALSKAVVLIQNEGENNLKVDVTTSPGNKHIVADIVKHHNKKVNISLANGRNNVITLKAGHGDCVLQIVVQASQRKYPEWLPSYSKFMTPTFGAYLLISSTVIAGVVWACCWFRKRKRLGDIPYRELEMSMPESAVAAETTDGWDQGWDDDWDEEKAVRSPGGRNISANGLTSRTSNKDGWEDWDD